MIRAGVLCIEHVARYPVHPFTQRLSLGDLSGKVNHEIFALTGQKSSSTQRAIHLIGSWITYDHTIDISS